MRGKIQDHTSAGSLDLQDSFIQLVLAIKTETTHTSVLVVLLSASVSYTSMTSSCVLNLTFARFCFFWGVHLLFSNKLKGPVHSNTTKHLSLTACLEDSFGFICPDFCYLPLAEWRGVNEILRCLIYFR